MYDMPLVRLTLEGMKYQIVHAFHKYTDDMEGKIDQAVQAAIKNFDFDREVAKAANSLIQETVNQSLKSAFHQLQWDDKLALELAEVIIKEIRSNIKDK